MQELKKMNVVGKVACKAGVVYHMKKQIEIN